MDLDPAALTIAIGGVVTIIGALVTGTITIIAAIHRTSEKVENVNTRVEEVTEVQNTKLDTITVLVDGRYSDVLDRVASLQEMVASLTGKPEDMALATRARSDASAQNEQVVKSKVDEQRAASLLKNPPKQLNELKQPPDQSSDKLGKSNKSKLDN